MFIIIPTGRRYTARIQLQVARQCSCERCGAGFAYKFNVTGTGTGSSPLWLRNEEAGRDAENAAVKAAEKEAQKAFPPFPCPGCGHFQSNMVRYYKKSRLKWLFALSIMAMGLVLFIASIWALGAGIEEVLTAELFWWALSIPTAALIAVLIVRKYATPKPPKQLPGAI